MQPWAVKLLLASGATWHTLAAHCRALQRGTQLPTQLPTTHVLHSGGGCIEAPSGPGTPSSTALLISTPTAAGPKQAPSPANSLVYPRTMPCSVGGRGKWSWRQNGGKAGSQAGVLKSLHPADRTHPCIALVGRPEDQLVGASVLIGHGAVQSRLNVRRAAGVCCPTVGCSGGIGGQSPCSSWGKAERQA